MSELALFRTRALLPVTRSICVKRPTNCRFYQYRKEPVRPTVYENGPERRVQIMKRVRKLALDRTHLTGQASNGGHATWVDRRKTMTHKIADKSKMRKFGYGGLLLTTLLLSVVAFAVSADDRKVETIDATAMGTSTQMGRIVNVKVTIYEYSTDEDREILVEAFKKGQNQGLVNALTKMKSVGRIAITGTIGYDLSFIRLIPTPTGRKIRFVTNRLVKFGEAYYNTQSTAYNLTAGEIDINGSDKDKHSGVLYPAAQLVINKEGQLEFNLRQNAWKLTNIIDWDKAGTLK